MIFYIEEEIKNHFKTQNILKKFPKKTVIYIERYSEIFNRKNQNFLLQKNHMAFIIAKKYGSFVHRLKAESGIGSFNNFYFSLLLNCPYDCMYCFLKGFYRSSFFLFFVNFEDFQKEIEKTIEEHPFSYFFAGYDADSFALDDLTEINQDLLSFFKDKKAFLELRTKSTKLEKFLKNPPLENVIVSYSLNPALVIHKIEKKTPSLKQRIEAIAKLEDKGFNIGLRFDPLIYHEGYRENYRSLFYDVFSSLKKEPHSVALGPLRFPKACYQNMQKSDHKNFLLAPLLENESNAFSYDEEKRNELVSFCFNEIAKYFPKEKLFIYKGCS